MQKVLFISHDANRAGSQLLLLQLIGHLKKQGVPTHLLLCEGGSLVEEFGKVTSYTLISQSGEGQASSVLRRIAKKISGKSVPQSAPSVTHYGWLEEQFREFDFGLVFVNSIANAEFYHRHLGFLHQLPVVLFAHELAMSVGIYTETSHLKFLLDQCDHLIAVSRAVANFYIQAYQYPASQVSTFTLINTADIIERSTKSNSAFIFQQLNLPADALVVGGCGNAEWRKGNDIFNLIARGVIERLLHLPVYFVWIGADQSHAFYEQIRFDIETFDLSDRIILIPPTPEALDYMMGFDVFLLSSREDPYPLVVLEAALLQKPIVCFEKAGGAPELVEDDAGEVVGYLDIEAAIEKITNLLEHKALRLQLGKRAHDKVLERHNTDQSIEKVMAILRAFTPSPASELTTLQ